LTVPGTAVVREDNKDHVFLKTGTNEFMLHEVELGPEIRGRRVVMAGLTDTQEIAIDGAFHLNNKRKQDMTKGAQ
jgi:membrane fusion protein, heavy metal efflux system